MPHPKVALVFGGSGFIGRHLLEALTKRGLIAISADIAPLDPPIPGVHSVHCDVRDPIPDNLVPINIARKIDTVYNLAAVHKTPGHPDREYYDTNVSGALNVTAFCRRTNTQRLFFTSSISVYGPDENVKDETSPLRPETPYGCSKLQAEIIHQNWQREDSSRRLIVVRPAVIFGKGEAGNFTRLAKALRTRRFIYPGRRDTIKACGYVEELVRTLDFAASLDREQFLYNFCYPTPYTLEDICKAFHEVTGTPMPQFTLPHSAMRSLATPFEWFSELGLESGIHRERIDKLVRSTHIHPQALLSAGYVYKTDLNQALALWKAETAGRFY